MSKYEYSPTRTEEMEEFLQKMAKIAEHFYKTHGTYLNHSFVYHQLCDFGLRPGDFAEAGRSIDISSLFDGWIARYYGDPNMEVHVRPSFSHFCLFDSRHPVRQGEFIKLYIPLDFSHLYNGANILFDYIESLGIPHASKIARVLRSDNIVIRLNPEDYESAMRIIDFVNGNDYLREGLNPTNPFLPTINGVGIMHDSGGSYNSGMAKMIAAYINSARKNNEPVSVEAFYEWFDAHVSEVVPNLDLQDMVDTFGIVSSGSKTVQLGQGGEQQGVETQMEGAEAEQAAQASILSKKQKVAIFLDAVKATYIEYGPAQVAKAIEEAVLHNDYNFFTNGSEETAAFRDILEANVTREEIAEIVNVTLDLSGQRSAGGVQGDAEAYTALVLKDEMAFRFDEACQVTLEKYGPAQVATAIFQYVLHGEIAYFSRYISPKKTDVNYRERIDQMTPDMVMASAEASLHNRGVDTTGMSPNDIVTTYANTLARERYASVARTPKLK